MNILVSNDDGINARGLRELVEALSAVEGACIYVAAPREQRSASSHALGIGKMINVRKVDFPGAAEALDVDGTPADCVKLGLHILERRGIKIDAVYAGINHGGNLGGDTKYSGTVSAAAEGVFEGLPGVAVSVDSHHPEHFEAAGKLAVSLLPYAIKTAGKGRVININTPDLPPEEIKGVKAAKLGDFKYDHWLETVTAGRSESTCKYSGEPVVSPDWEDTADIKLIRAGYATVSAIKYDLNDYEGFEELKDWEMKL